jgi:hypothetical protein
LEAEELLLKVIDDDCLFAQLGVDLLETLVLDPPSIDFTSALLKEGRNFIEFGLQVGDLSVFLDLVQLVPSESVKFLLLGGH